MKLNEPIVYEDTFITKIHRTRLPKPCLIRAILYRSPKLRFAIESNEFPRFILNEFNRKSFKVALNNGIKIKVLISQINDISESCFEGSLDLEDAPSLVADPKNRLQCVRFKVVNFNKFYGSRNQLVQNKFTHKLLGMAKFETICGWDITIEEDPNFREQENALKQEDGYIITHRGTVKRSDGNDFSVEEAKNFVDGLRYFLSFLRGKRCGIVCVTSEIADGKNISLMWGTSKIDPWVKNYRLLLGTNGGGDRLSAAFPGFWNLFACKSWKKTICRAINFYLDSQEYDIETGIVLVQAALESLSSKINSNRFRPASRALREALEELELPRNIPHNCKKLKHLVKQFKEDDGPEAITQIRNDIIHADQRYEVSWKAMIEIRELCLWYIEVILLRKFKYGGNYWNRLSAANENTQCTVPWECEDIESKDE